MSDSRRNNVPDVTMLKNLRLIKHLELLNVVDDLRAQGLNEHVDLPQLIDQSSGKSSVLAAVSGVPFPKKDNLCTPDLQQKSCSGAMMSWRKFSSL